MAGRPTGHLSLSREEQARLTELAESKNLRTATRARIILCRATGLSQEETARKLSCSSKRVSRWTVRFRKDRLKALERTSRETETGRLPPREDAPSYETTPGQATVRSVASIAKVSPMTVSRVFHNHPHVREETRNRVLQAAKECGYTSDPELTKLMHHLRKRRIRRIRGIICSLESRSWVPDGGRYFKTLLAGAKSGAEMLGYAWDSFVLEEVLANPANFTRVCYHRGIEGIFIAPAPHTLQNSRLPPNADWGQFSILAATYSIPSPNFHRVVPNHFKNITLLCESLFELGYRRIGLAIPENLDKILFRHISGGYHAFHHDKQLSGMPVPFLYSTSRVAENLQGWFRREKPDAIIASSGMNGLKIAEELKLKIPGPVAIAALALPEGLTAGIDELPEQIGRIAAERLANLMMMRQTGLPSLPTVIMVDGLWRHGESAPARV